MLYKILGESLAKANEEQKRARSEHIRGNEGIQGQKLTE